MRSKEGLMLHLFLMSFTCIPFSSGLMEQEFNSSGYRGKKRIQREMRRKRHEWNDIPDTRDEEKNEAKNAEEKSKGSKEGNEEKSQEEKRREEEVKDEGITWEVQVEGTKWQERRRRRKERTPWRGRGFSGWTNIKILGVIKGGRDEKDFRRRRKEKESDSEANSLLLVTTSRKEVVHPRVKFSS